jgi:radical SAM/Cys-rich protein
MGMETLELVLQVLKARGIKTLDITGGAPELNPGFRNLVRRAREMDVHIIDRCNLTVMAEPGQEDLARFLAEQGIEVTASLPCYTESNVDKQRGSGAFEKSIAALRSLNALGYGQQGSGLMLNLVYNPLGPFLPPAQHKLDADYRRELRNSFGITFSRLLVLTNMPIQRFGSMLVSKGQMSGYMKLLKDSFMAANLDSVMCRSLVSVDWQGFLYDCDFNQMLGMPLRVSEQKGKPHLRDLLDPDVALGAIRVADHCYGCTAGQGSSCAGALAA